MIQIHFLTEDMLYPGMKIALSDGRENFKYKIEKITPMRHWDSLLKRWQPIYDYEVILDRKTNAYFSLNLFNSKKSWVKKISIIECDDFYKNLFKSNCYNCEFCTYETGDIGDPEGYVCNRKELYGSAEKKMLEKMESSIYMARSKVCFTAKDMWA